MEILVLGPGCENCHKLEVLTRQAVADLGIEAEVTHISDIAQIMQYTMNTPGLVVNGKLVHSGKPLPSLEKIKELLR